MNVIAAKEVHTRHSLLGFVSNGMKTDATVSGIFMLDGQPKCGQPYLPACHLIVHLLIHPIQVVVVVYSLSTTPLAILVASPQPFVIHIQTHFHSVPPNQCAICFGCKSNF